jgi:hypothetical protein
VIQASKIVHARAGLWHCSLRMANDLAPYFRSKLLLCNVHTEIGIAQSHTFLLFVYYLHGGAEWQMA